ncbi:MAG: hypothetical protein M3R61_07045, partial [Chloroflexota bacterium]|nr:hypothetical protein [Chloroflexota bacterium]
PAHAEAVGALVQRTVQRIVEGVDLAMRDELIGEFARVHQEFSATATTATERLFVEEISLAWLELYKLRIAHMALAPAQAVYWSRTLDSAQLRFLRATELLGRMQRRLTFPVDGGG